jgi:hypothetical protein
MRGKQCNYNAGKTSGRIISPPDPESSNDEVQEFPPGVGGYPKETQLQPVEPASSSDWALSSTNQDVVNPAPESLMNLTTSASSFDTVEDLSIDNSWIGNYFNDTRRRSARSPSFQFNAGLSAFWNNPEPIGFELTPHLAYGTGLSTLQPKSPRYLLKRTLTSPVASANAQFLLQTLRTYPRMMLRKDTYPPLVHAYSHNDQHANSSIEDPLSVCINIIQLFYSKSTQSSPFVWRSIRFEQERLYNQVIVSTPKLLHLAEPIYLSSAVISINGSS